MRFHTLATTLALATLASQYMLGFCSSATSTANSHALHDVSMYTFSFSYLRLNGAMLSVEIALAKFFTIRLKIGN